MGKRGLYDNINAKKKSGTSRSKSKSTISDEDYANMKSGFNKAKEGASILKRIGVSGYNKPKKTPGHATKSHAVVAKSDNTVKVIRFGQQGVSGAGSNPSTKKDKARQNSFKARHSKNISKGVLSAAYWADKVKW